MRRSLLAALVTALVTVLACSPGTPKDKASRAHRVPPPDDPQAEAEPSVIAAPAFANVSAGYDHSCGVTEHAELFCWGRNDQGQLGDSTTEEHALPVQVGEAMKWRAVTVGGAHSCAITNDGATYCWGSSIAGQLGSDTLG